MKRVTLGRFAFQYRTCAEWEQSQLILYAGELAVEGDTGLMKVGDGRRLYAELPYFNRGEKGDKGERGEKGETGAALNVKGTKNSASDLPAKGAAGDAYMVGGDLYVWSETAWTNVGRIKGEKGDRGEPGQKGDPPKLTISDAGTWVVEGVDTGKRAMGPKGEQGDPGVEGKRGLPMRYDDLTPEQKQEVADMVNIDLTPYAKKTEVKTRLSDLTGDDQHTTLTKAEKEKVAAIPKNPKYTDTKTTINGKTGEITKEDFEALGVGGMTKEAVRTLAMQIAYSDYLFSVPTGLGAKLKELYNVDLGAGVENSHDLVNNKAALQTLIYDIGVFYVALRSFTFCGELATNKTAIQTVATNKAAMQAVAASLTAVHSITGSPMAMQTIVANNEAMQTLIANEVTLLYIAENHTAMRAILTNAAATKIMLSNYNAMQAIAKNYDILKMVLLNGNGIKEAANNNTARNAMLNSPYTKVATKTGQANEKITDKSVILLSVETGTDYESFAYLYTLSNKKQIFYNKAGIDVLYRDNNYYITGGFGIYNSGMGNRTVKAHYIELV